ncbi:MAG TPA: S16 family serine protease [Chloroflexota bacterium]|nr:S16 family serine protease [Chloroflexota bacterium]
MATTVKPRRRIGFRIPPRVEKIVNILSIVAIVLLLAMIALWKIPSKYLIYLPATAEAVNPHLYVAGHPSAGGRGQFLFTFVAEPDSNLLEEIFARLNPDASLEPEPPSFSASQYQQQNVQMMLSSEQTAELVALCHLGYNLCDTGVVIEQVATFSKDAKILKAGDVIVGVNGTRVATTQQLSTLITGHPAGTIFPLTLQRGGKTITVRAVTTRSPNPPNQPVLGVTIQQGLAQQFPSKLPIDMKINAGDIGGPSAGLMFTLGLLERLSPTDLTKGYSIAGTGTIALDGTVGAIGGIKQKVIGAEWAHANYFFAPVDGGNYTDAKKVVGHGMTLVPVRTLDDALNFLKTLPPKK